MSEELQKLKDEMDVLQIRHDTKSRAMTEIFNNNVELQAAMQILQKQVNDGVNALAGKQKIIDELQKRIVELTPPPTTPE